MAHRSAMKAAGSLYRPLIRGKDHGIALPERDDLAARLHARPLLDQHELAAGEIADRVAQQHGRLQRKDEIAVEVPVQAVVVAGPVAQQQWRRPFLAAGMAFVEPALQGRREALAGGGSGATCLDRWWRPC